MKKSKLSVAVASLLLGTALFTVGCQDDGKDGAAGAAGTAGVNAGSIEIKTKAATATNKQDVVKAYADKAQALYQAAYDDGVLLETAITTFTTTPSEDNLKAAKAAWLKARESYGLTEIFRLSQGPIDADEDGWVKTTYEAPEGLMNAWPLDEKGIDYTGTGASATGVTGTIIGLDFSVTDGSTTHTISALGDITKAKLETINEFAGDANVFTGYHAIEFMLWGQDQDYSGTSAGHPTATEGPLQAGNRSYKDYTTGHTSDSNKANAVAARKAYLNAVTDLLTDHLEEMKNAWADSATSYYRAFASSHSGVTAHTTGANNLTETQALTKIMGGMGTFIKSELANERMAVAIQTPSEEDEHSCFSDNTHRDIATNYEGFKMMLLDTGMLDIALPDTQIKIKKLIREIDAGVDHINVAAATSEHFDYQIKTNSVNRQNAYDTKNKMRELGDLMIEVASAYGITLTSSDVTDGEETGDLKNF
ncbi:MAG: imelysin [Campylobacterales bacterium]|nr:imelysin [Campylobacterales bacterium]